LTRPRPRDPGAEGGRLVGPGGPFARYRHLLDDWAGFARALDEPLPPCLWHNPARIGADALAELLQDEGLAPERVDWQPQAFRLHPDDRPGQLWAYRAGLFQIQEEAALLPVQLLAPAPGERVLDLCAAPGNKSAQIALALGNRGTVVANDRNQVRLGAVHDTVARLGLVNVTTTGYDGATYPDEAGLFDKVLVDAPCSAEGTVRKPDSGYRPSPPEFRRWVEGIQRALLRRAAALCRPGGRIVYATCTFAPEENEAVLDAVLQELGDTLRVLPAPHAPPGAAPALDAWQGKRFRDDMGNGVRLWPQRTGTGGFFAALMERRPEPAGASGEPTAETPRTPSPEPAAIEGYVEAFGLPPDTFAGVRCFRQGRHVRAVAADHRVAAGLKTVSTGLALCRADGTRPKLSTVAAMAFGRRARRRVIDLDREQTGAYHARRSFTPAPAQLQRCPAPGYVLLRHRGFVLGVATLTGDGVVESLFPKPWAWVGPA